MSDPEALSPEKQLQILRGATKVFGEEGYEGASMSHIAAAAGVSKGTLYNYFAGKAELFAAFVERECTLKIAQIFDGADTGDDPAQTLSCIAHRIVRLVLSPTGLTIYRVCVSEAFKFPELARIFFDAGPARSIAQLSAWLAEQHRRGALRVPDPEFAAEQFFALCQTRIGIRARLRIVEAVSDRDIDEVVRGAVAMFLGTYGAGFLGTYGAEFLGTHGAEFLGSHGVGFVGTHGAGSPGTSEAGASGTSGAGASGASGAGASGTSGAGASGAHGAGAPLGGEGCRPTDNRRKDEDDG